AGPCRRASRSWLIGSRAEHQPPLRPLAPKPIVSRSTTATRSEGSAARRYQADQRPVSPPPTMATSTSTSPPSGTPVARSAAGRESDQRDRPGAWFTALRYVDPPARLGLPARPDPMEHLPPPTTAPAGWYPDAVSRGLRYFDGVRWHDPVVSSVGSSVGSGLGEHGFAFEEVEEHPHLPVSVALGALAVLVVSLVVGKSVVEALAGRDWPLVVYIAISALLSYGPSIGWLWYVRGRWGSGRFGAIGWRFRWVALAWGPITWAAAIGVQILLAAAVLVFDIPLSSNVDSISDGDADRAYLVATAIAAVIAAPIVEELVFRGLVLRGLLSRLGPVLAVGLQGVLFGVAHVDPARGVGNLGLAIVL